MIRYEGLGIEQVYLGDVVIYRIYKGDKLIWELEVLANFFSSDNQYIVTSDNYTFNAKQE